jgi:hypothetical protein
MGIIFQAHSSLYVFQGYFYLMNPLSKPVPQHGIKEKIRKNHCKSYKMRFFNQVKKLAK